MQCSAIPECVSNPVFEVDKISVILDHQISRVEIYISLFKHISQQLLFRHGFVPRVAKKRVGERQGSHQQADFTWNNRITWQDTTFSYYKSYRWMILNTNYTRALLMSQGRWTILHNKSSDISTNLWFIKRSYYHWARIFIAASPS